ncbi:uncharacterized protein LOC124162479 [Ischnura elegans]|uniref:uncharacterized protein LOC124162479 n=1 Tax=Ischnura elegans TaxID=197161 RepID=UPI001ED8A679|nr:uncharacterized protein LOC124162479 [Ischnura elegans]
MFGAASDFYAEVASVLADDGTSWSFIPPNFPHFGGLWEAGVKSTKHHLLRVVGEHTLTFEEFSTVLIQIAACLNSRPLHPMSSDPDDLNALTPAHFLIGDTLFLIPEPECPNISGNCLSRWRLLQRLQLNFWKRWSREYLHHLQQRTKWRDPKENFTVKVWFRWGAHSRPSARLPAATSASRLLHEQSGRRRRRPDVERDGRAASKKPLQCIVHMMSQWRPAAAVGRSRGTHQRNQTLRQLMIVRDDRYPPSKWPLGRITEVHPGPDGLVRVVTVKMANTTLQRPIVRLSPLPMPAGQ